MAPALVALAATVLMLGLPLMGGAAGREVRPRVFIVATIALLTYSVLAELPTRRTRTVLTVALGTLGATLVLALSNIAPTGVILLAIALGGVWCQRRLLSPAA